VPLLERRPICQFECGFQGERLPPLGACGGGKSTLTKMLAGMCGPDEGTRLLHGLD
jgi:ABC-type bacteriocin/lantibiotic exporter with double-glycine peptidase domain